MENLESAKSPWQQRGVKMELELYIINLFALQFHSQMGNKLNQQRAVKKWCLLQKTYTCVYVCLCLHVYRSISNVYISMEWGDKLRLPLGAWQAALGVPGQETALNLSCDILGSSLSQEMPSWPAADKIKSSKEGCRVFMSNQSLYEKTVVQITAYILCIQRNQY